MEYGGAEKKGLLLSRGARKGPGRGDEKGDGLRVATLNILYDMSDWIPGVSCLTRSRRRFAATLDLLQELGADLIGLNECTHTFERMLKGSKLMSEYHVFHPKNLRPMGNILLSRYPFESTFVLKLPGLRRDPVCGVVRTMSGTRVLAVSAHLSALTSGAARRELQLRTLISKCCARLRSVTKSASVDALIVMGDLNFHLPEEDTQLRDLHQFGKIKSSPQDPPGHHNNSETSLLESCVDLWEALRPTEKGFTYDPTRNRFIKVLRFWENRQMRLDRILLFNVKNGHHSHSDTNDDPRLGMKMKHIKSQKLSRRVEPKDIRMLADLPLRKGIGCLPLFCSDHFGLVASLD
mmetsp:Transcript_20732/g.50876  ORF Transcript_20732/g.50876 Transcript_20732/m.50876 type:complete len:350 (+) Transcript_20732:109-1158(+)